MNKLTTALLSAAMFAGLGAGAQSRLVNEFPPMLPPQADASALQAGPAKAPLNVERALGTKIFAVTSYDFDIARHYVHVYSEKPGELKKLNTVLFAGTSDEQTPVIHGLTAGAWAGDGYFGYKTALYSTGSVYLDSWVQVDPETGVSSVLKDMSNPSFTHAWTYTYDLAWNPKDGQFYGLANGDQPNQYGSVTSKIIRMDKKDGTNLGDVKALDDYYFCMAFDYDGNLYAIRWTYKATGERTGCNLDIFDQDLDRTKTMPLYVDGASFLIYFQNGLEFDYTTGDLYWTAANDDTNGYLIRINPESGATTNLGRTGYSEMLKAPYIPFRTAEARTAPARVNDLAFTANATGDNKVSLYWTNPSTQWNRKALSTLKEVRVYRDGATAPVATLDAAGQEGKAMNWEDTGAAKGVHSYTVVPVSADGKAGISADIDAYVGHDTPGPVRNLTATATADGKGVNLSWAAPATGDSNGWFDAATLKYSITRLPDNEKVADGLTATTFSDLNIPQAQAYSYVVTPSTTDGEGTPVTSDKVIAGSSLVPPFSVDFNDEMDAARFTSIDKNQDGNKFYWKYNTNTTRYAMGIIMSNGDNDDILATPPLSLKKGHTYRLQYHIGIGAYGQSTRKITHHFKFLGGNAATAEALTTELGDKEYTTNYNHDDFDIDCYFVSPVDGDYFAGIELLTSNENDVWTYIENFQITECPDDDLMVEDFKTYLNLSKTESNKFSVTVYNNGQNTQSKYKVGVAHVNAFGEPVIFAETADVPALQPHQRATVTLYGSPDRIGDVDVLGVVTLEGDGNTANNSSAVRAVSVDEYTAFTHTVTDGNEDVDPNVPMTHANSLSVVQTIYTPAMTGIVADGDITITRLAWEYTGLDTFSGTNYQVYLTETPKTGFADGSLFTPITDEPLYDGPLMVRKGLNYALADLEEEFTFDPKKNLLVTVVKHEPNKADWLTSFRVFDNVWNDASTHSLRYAVDGASFDMSKATSVSPKRYAPAPVLHIAAYGINTGIAQVAGGAAAMLVWNMDACQLSANATMASVKVYNVAGAQVASMAPAATNATLRLPAGIYIVRATMADGSVATAKIIAK